MSVWNDKQFAKDYADNSGSLEKNWFEHEVNFWSLLSMLPQGAKRVLDYGSGPGEFTKELSNHFEHVDGTDYSQEMVVLAGDTYPELNFYNLNELLQQVAIERYDAVVSKLAVHFVEDLEVLARDLRSIVKPGGVFAFSVPHPMATASKVDDYWVVSKYDTEIGTYGMRVTMIHRSLTDYLLPFITNGFMLKEIQEPQIPLELAKRYGEAADRLRIPRRLNLGFVNMIDTV